jgi:hypothetical protein
VKSKPSSPKYAGPHPRKRKNRGQKPGSKTGVRVPFPDGMRNDGEAVEKVL